MQQAEGIKSIAIIGGGKMGEAIMAGLIQSQKWPAYVLDASCFQVANPGQQRRVYLQETYGVSCVEDGSYITTTPDMVILAVKPQVLPQVMMSLRSCAVFGEGAVACKDPRSHDDSDIRVRTDNESADTAPQTMLKKPLFVSIAAGVTTQTLRSFLPEDARVVRTMPNTPLLVGAGMTAVVGDAAAQQEDVCLVRDLFACLGDAVVVSEDAMDAVCAVSGSGPAYVAAFIEALRDGGVHQGLSFELAQTLAMQTIFGTVQLLRETQQAPEKVRQDVCSPGGTTIAALDAMNEAGFVNVIESGVAAATKRSLELGASS